MPIIEEIVAAISRNPKIKKVIVSPVEIEEIRKEFAKMQFVKPSPRPTYGGPFGDVDRLLWDNMVAAQKLAEIRIMDRPVVTKA